MSDLVSNHKYQRWGNSDVQPCSQPQRCVLREHIFTPGSWFKNKTNMKCKRLLTFTQYLSAGQNRQSLICVSEVQTCLLIMVENVPCFPSSSQTAAPMCWDVPGISFFLSIPFIFTSRCQWFRPTSPLRVTHRGSGRFRCSPPLTSVLYYCQWSPCRHTSLIRFQILRMVVRAYIKCNKNHGALRSRAAVETKSRTCKALRFTRKYMPVSHPLHISLLYFIYYLAIFRIYLTVSLCFSVCNCAQQVWSTGQSPPPPQN